TNNPAPHPAARIVPRSKRVAAAKLDRLRPNRIMNIVAAAVIDGQGAAGQAKAAEIDIVARQPAVNEIRPADEARDEARAGRVVEPVRTIDLLDAALVHH